MRAGGLRSREKRSGTRWILLAVALGSALAGPTQAPAQAPIRMFRIGYLLLPPLAADPTAERAAFLDGLRERHLIVGRTFIVEYRSANWNGPMLDALAQELAQLKVDVLFAPGTQAALAARRATATIPIVTTAIADPVGSGLVKSLARPGGNVTGIAMVSNELGAKRLELLREAVPHARTIAVLRNPTHAVTEYEYASMQEAARVLGVTLQPVAVGSAEDFARALDALARQKPDAVIAVLDPWMSAYREILAEWQLKHGVPVSLGHREFAEAGGLMSYGPDISDLYRRAAYHVSRVLRGARPGELPFEPPVKFELVVNLKTARALGLTIPGTLLLRATQVIE